MEPWDGMRLAPRELFRSLREEIGRGELARGKLDHAALRDRGVVEWIAEGAAPIRVEHAPETILAIKWPAYWQLLDRLPDTKFIVCVRHPYEVIASFKRRGGRLARGFEYATPFNRRLNRELAWATIDRVTRRALFYETVHRTIAAHLGHPNVFVLHHHRWFTEPDVVMAELGVFVGAPLGSPQVRLEASPPAKLPDRELAVIRRLCPSARDLGYEL